MSIVQALADKHAAGELVRAAMKDLKDACCKASVLEVYDMDRYAQSLNQAQPPASMDGAWVGALRGKDHLLLVEMKSLKNVALEFHYGECAKAGRGQGHEETVSRCQAEFKAFVDRKIAEWDFEAKMHGTQELLTGMDAGLADDLQSGAVVERCFIACDLSSREFINYRDTFKSVLKDLANDIWRVPMAVPCSQLNNEHTLRTGLGAG